MYAGPVTDRHARYWEDLARREAYFRVLTSEGSAAAPGNADATVAFFETGEDDVANLLAAITSVLGHDLRMTSTLDFGCGVGRLTLPLARRSLRVVACDAAPTMLAHAQRNAEAAAVRNITFMRSEDLASWSMTFDLICSLLVFQYIPRVRGYAILSALMHSLAPGGVAAIQITFRQRRNALPRLVRFSRAFSRRTIHTVSRRRTGELPYLVMHEYDEYLVRDTIEAGGARLLARLPTDINGTGSVLIILKPLGKDEPV